MASPEEWISAWDLRRLFNQERFYARMLNGEFREEILEDGHPSPQASGQPCCTRSIQRSGGRTQVVIAHQYRLRDGTLGASGRPDPKGVLFDGVWWLSDD